MEVKIFRVPVARICCLVLRWCVWSGAARLVIYRCPIDVMFFVMNLGIDGRCARSRFVRSA